MSAAMLDASNPLPVLGAEVLAWADLGSADVVWALPARPRLAMAADGQPDVTLLLYRRGAGNPPDGGQLTMAADLALTAAERAAAAAAGAARRPAPTDRDAPPPPPVEVRTPSWVEAQVHVELVDGISAEGRPSLMGDNMCMLTMQLDAAQAAEVQAAWEDGFPDATIELRGTVDGARSAAATATLSTATTSSSDTSTDTDDTHTDDADTDATDRTDDAGPTAGCAANGDRQVRTGSAQLRVTVAAAAQGAVGVPLHLHGPLRLPAAARTARRTDLTL